MLKIKTIAPEFKLPDQYGKERSLRDYKKSYVLVYFYPADDTIGCTKEACVIRDLYEDFQSNGVKVFGISVNTVESHKKFARKYNLPFTILSDPNKKAIKPYGADGGLFSKRISYLLGPNNIILKAYLKVDPAHHGAEILKDIYKLNTPK
jgi:thioredoxin-dependent peroxiredoxin